MSRRGTAYFSRKLNELTDDEYDVPSKLPGWSRRFVIAHVGYNARAITRLVEWARTEIETPMYLSTQQRNEEIAYGATLDPVALRNLHYHAAVALDVEWRDLPADSWRHRVRTIQGRYVPVSETLWMRTREIWLHAVDLGNGGSFADFPPSLVDRVLTDVKSSWGRRGVGQDISLQPSDRVATELHPPNATVLQSTAAKLAQWATGRSSGLIPDSAGAVLQPPQWL